ncbi:MAG: hypothetical protein BHV96_06610 [Clostridium sp. CAG:354_28_25]|nr:MAG: hypothetical protein BHV96_06610 [Clostridium sp. CAG:354_28_25]
MTENTNEKELKEKRSRYSDVAVILRQLYGVRMTGMPGYILLQDVLYKYLENKNLTIDELVEWACKHFVFTISVDDAYDEILQVVTQQLPEAENGEEDVMMLLPKVLSEATDLYEKRMLFGKITEAVHKLKISPMIKQDIISILFEIKRGKTIDQALEKLANEDVAGVTEAERLKEKAKRKKELHNIILVAFSSEVELLEFAETIE